MFVATKRDHKRAVVAVARKLAVIMHRMWLDGSEVRFAVAADEHEDGGVERKTTALAAACSGSGARRLADGQRVELPPRGGETFGGSKRMRRARYLAGVDTSLEIESMRECRCCPRSRHRHVRPHGTRGCEILKRSSIPSGFPPTSDIYPISGMVQRPPTQGDRDIGKLPPVGTALTRRRSRVRGGLARGRLLCHRAMA